MKPSQAQRSLTKVWSRGEHLSVSEPFGVGGACGQSAELGTLQKRGKPGESAGGRGWRVDREEN